jgi:hypothetical protein
VDATSATLRQRLLGQADATLPADHPGAAHRPRRSSAPASDDRGGPGSAGPAAPLRSPSAGSGRPPTR